MNNVFLRFSYKRVCFVGLLALCVFALAGCNGSSSVIDVHSKDLAPVSPAPLVRLTPEATMQLQTYQQWIALFQQYAGNVSHDQQLYMLDQQALESAPNDVSYQKALATIRTHIVDIQLPTLKAEAAALHQQLQQKVATWGNQHTYYNAYDQTTYHLGYEYSSSGAEWVLGMNFDAVQTTADYQQLVETLHQYLTFFDAMVSNTSDKAAYNTPHATDKQLLTQYKLLSQKVVVVSLQEQAVRVYQNGQLVNSFLVTTGRPTHPTLPGIWNIEIKLQNTVFKSGAPKDSPDYYADTPINYAMQYHSEGYFLHDSWWRADYGPDTQFPHQDATGNASAENGSHGCVNIATPNASWLYNFVDLNTPVLIY